LAAKLAFSLQALKQTGSDLAKQVGDYRPLAEANQPTNMAIGAGVGGLAGLVSGLHRGEDGKRHWLRNALLGGLIGTGAGAATTPLAKAFMRHVISTSDQGNPVSNFLAHKVPGPDFLTNQIAEGATNKDILNTAGNFLNDLKSK
jgi:hypothetical protein